MSNSSTVNPWPVVQFNHHNAGYCIKRKQSLELAKPGRAEASITGDHDGMRPMGLHPQSRRSGRSHRGMQLQKVVQRVGSIAHKAPPLVTGTLLSACGRSVDVIFHHHPSRTQAAVAEAVFLEVPLQSFRKPHHSVFLLKRSASRN